PAAEAPSGRLEAALAQAKELWNALAGDMWNEIRQLVRVRSVQHPESLLLSPTETFYARENLKLRLLSARLSLLARKESTLRSDLVGAQATINRYFDTSARQTKAVQALL